MTMMKMKKNVLWLLLMVLAVASLTSCGSDGDGSVVIPPANPPKFESVSGKYEISDNTSPYESVELGASGDYVVTKCGYTSSQASTKAKGMLSLEREASLTRAATDGGVIYGTYTQIDGNTFNLEGFGVIELLTNGGETVTGISITPNGGNEMTFSASKAQEMGSDELTEALCRTWKVIGGVEKGYDHYDGEYEYPFDANDPDALKEIMFTKSGTFLNLYNDNTIEALFWKWGDQGKMLLRGSWDNIWYNDDDGNFTVQFSAGNRLTIREYYVDNESGEWYDNTIELEEKNPTSTDDEEVIVPSGQSPLEKVFTGNLVDIVDDHGRDQFIYQNGFLTQVKYVGDSYEHPYVINFEYLYLNSSKPATDPDVRYTKTREDGTTSYVYNIWLNEAGFAKDIKSTHYEEDGTTVSFDFESSCRYDSEGHLVYMNEGREEREYNLTWTGGDITSIETVGRHTTNYSYNESLNENNLMFFYDMFDMDIEELKYLYWAGLMGMAPKHTLIHSEEMGYEEGVYDYQWEANRILSKRSYEGDDAWEEIVNFTFVE